MDAIQPARVALEDQILNAQAATVDTLCSPTPPPLACNLVLQVTMKIQMATLVLHAVNLAQVVQDP